MGLLDKFEGAVERGLNSAFSRAFRSQLKAVDVVSALRRKMDDDAEYVGSDHAITTNHFTVEVSPTDLAALEQMDLEALQDEFCDDLTRHATAQRYVLLGRVEVEFVAKDSELTGRLEVVSQTQRSGAAPATVSAASQEHPILDIGGERWILTDPVTVIGRGSDADIQIHDSGVSRHHLEIRVTPTGVIATDLGSTNGTFVEGHRIDAATLLDGNQLLIGRTQIDFWTSSSPYDFDRNDEEES